jgi:hypothetical protein
MLLQQILQGQLHGLQALLQPLTVAYRTDVGAVLRCHQERMPG